MYVIKRDGSREEIKFDKITRRLTRQANKLEVEPILVAQEVIRGIYAGVTTVQLDELAAETAAFMTTIHPDYGIFAARIAATNLQKCTPKTFMDAMTLLHDAKHDKTGAAIPLIADDAFEVMKKHAVRLNNAIRDDRDLEYDFFGFQTLARSYMLKLRGRIMETPQYMLMRTAVGIHMDDIEAVIETYTLMSKRVFTHATPTLFNACTPKPQMSSCFLLTMKEDSINGIYDTLSLCAKISKYAGGIGLAVHDIRAKGSYIAGTNGNSNGLVPMLRVFDATARYVDQGGGKRKGSFAIYMEPWHADIEEFLDLKKNTGKEEARARDLFYALWTPDLFMKRVQANESWTLFCPHEAPGLNKVYGEAFEALYAKYEAEGRGRKTVRAQDLWAQILTAQIETGTPYMLYKDACNRKSNQQNLGTIQSSNLCCEIVQYSSPDEIAVCNLASINLTNFVHEREFDLKGLIQTTKIVVRNLNRVIDRNYYPVPEAERSNRRHRPIGVGVQGLADTFMKMGFPFESEEARTLNRDIFECIYYGACEASMELAKLEGPYETFPGSPMSRGILQFDMWEKKPNPRLGLDWEGLRARIVEHGVRNSLLVAPMPTATTSQILGQTEGCEALTSNIYSRRVLAGDFIVVNTHLVRHLIRLGLWSPAMKNLIIGHRGSIQAIADIPEAVKSLYKTVWEIKQLRVLELAADRGAFIDQSQSMNIYFEAPSLNRMSMMHMKGWELGLKTGMYYLRTKPAADAIQFTVDKSAMAQVPPAPAPVPPANIRQVSDSSQATTGSSEGEESATREEGGRVSHSPDGGEEQGCTSCGT